MTKAAHPEGPVLQAYHDSELDAARAAEVEAHCAACEACRAELEQLGELERMLAAVEAPEMRRGVWQGLQEARAPETRFRPVFAIAACAAGIVLGVLIGPLQLGESATEESAWSESLSLWSSESTSSLLGVYESGLE